jgi:TP901 family phage tail tape measure protein
MTERVETVRLTAIVSNYQAGMEAARVGTVKLTTSLAQQKAAAAAAAVAQGEASKKIGTAFLAIGAVAAVGVGLAIKEFADFDAKMSQVQTLSHATAGDMADLTQAALTAGQKIGFSATQVADAEIEMVKAGISVKDILGGALPGALQLAAAGQIDVADATEIATIAMTQFGLKGKDIPHVADLLTAGADKALGGVQDLGEALKSGGLVAAQFGVSLDETVGTLSAFANAGLIGETAGTDLRQMLLKLANPAADSAKDMKDLGINLYDASGQFVGITNLAGQLKDKLGALSPEARNAALATIFGSRAIAGANVLYKEGAKGISDWTKAVNDSGFAQQQASGKMNNLEGDIKKLGAAFQTGIIEGGSGANNILRQLTQNLTGLVTGISALPRPVAEGALALGTIVAVTALVSGGALTAVPKIVAFKAAIADLGITGRAAAIGIGTVAVAATALVLILAAVSQANADATAKTEAYGETLDANTHKITASTRASVENTLAQHIMIAGFIDSGRSAFDVAEQYGFSLKKVTDAASGNGPALKALNHDLNTNRDNFGAVEKAASATGQTTTTVQAQFDLLSQAINSNSGFVADSINVAKQKASADAKAAENGKTVAGSLDGVSASAQNADGSISDLTDQLNNFGKTTLDSRSAQRDFQQAVDDAAASLKANGVTLDINTQAGRDNQAALDAIAQKANAAAAAIYTQTGNQEDASAALTAGSAALYAAAAQYGLTGAAADDYVASVLATPAEIATTVTIDTHQAVASLSALQAQLRTVFTINQRAGLPDLNGKGSGTGRGGTFGSGGFTGYLPVNTVAGVVHGREFVTDAEATAKPANRAVLEFMHAGGDMARSLSSPSPTYVPAAASSPLAATQSVTETIYLQLDGKTVAATVRKYDRALK